MAMIHPQVVRIQPAVVAPAVEARTEMWASSISSCCDDMGICCLGLWCPCCLACQVSSDHGEGLCLPLVDLLCCLLPPMGIVPPIALALRTSVRERYRIQGSICDDCCVVTFCNPCAFCQMARELKERKRRLHLVTAVEVTSNPPPYVPQHPLPYVPQHPLPYVPQHPPPYVPQHPALECHAQPQKFA